MVTIDAIGCQKEIVSAIVDKKADYVLAVKDNQPNLHEDIQAALSGVVDATDAEPGYFTHERGHGRKETRQYFLSMDLSGIRGRKNWRGLKSVGMVVSERKVGEKESIEVRYYISSLSGNAKRFGETVKPGRKRRGCWQGRITPTSPAPPAAADPFGRGRRR